MEKDWVEIALDGAACGVYLLLRQGEVVYAGQSVNVFGRLMSHWNALCRARLGKQAAMFRTWEEPVIDFDAVRIKRCAKSMLDREELALIQRFRPKHNVLLNREPSPIDAELAVLPCIQALVKVARAREEQVRRRRIA